MWTERHSSIRTRLQLCYSWGYSSIAPRIRTSILYCGAIPHLLRLLILALLINEEMSWQLFLKHPTVFTQRYNWPNMGHPLPLLSISPRRILICLVAYNSFYYFMRQQTWFDLLGFVLGVLWSAFLQIAIRCSEHELPIISNSVKL